MTQFNSDAVLNRLLNEGEWWYALALFSDADLVALLTRMGIENVERGERIKIVLVLSQRLSESGKYVDMIRDYFNEHYLVPHGIPTHKSELWFNFGDCEQLVAQRIQNSDYDSNIDPQVHKDFVLNALTIQQLQEVYNINDDAPEGYENLSRSEVIERINAMNVVDAYAEFLRSSSEFSSVRTEHGAITEMLFGSSVEEE